MKLITWQEDGESFGGGLTKEEAIREAKEALLAYADYAEQETKDEGKTP